MREQYVVRNTSTEQEPKNYTNRNSKKAGRMYEPGTYKKIGDPIDGKVKKMRNRKVANTMPWNRNPFLD